MEAVKVDITRNKAAELHRQYKARLHYSDEMDEEIMRAYRLISEGKLIIKALESIKNAGLGDDGLPKLAIATADSKKVECRVRQNGSVRFDCRKVISWFRNEDVLDLRGRKVLRFPRGSFSVSRDRDGQALVPPCPLHLRPQRGIASYHILWEAEWERIPPRDPYLLRRIGKGDLWLVVAAWDLTEVERAALATRLTN